MNMISAAALNEYIYSSLILKIIFTFWFIKAKIKKKFYLSSTNILAFCPPTLQHNIHCQLMDKLLKDVQSFIDIFSAIKSSNYKSDHSL